MYTPKRCAFCGKAIHLGLGLMLILNDGSSKSYCSSKCKVNDAKLKRDPRKLKWARSS
ncbi:MAG: 50S ribosomal protein L24e [Thaumarchaeota archaeon]|nr:50S ribosomal protein L24e [Nitrososphaerota archaeon]MBI3116449.1 50S ribosomal protein L24e [Nitrososphaerota archaeon]MCS4540531.1 50S ribosomal protein L24e [Nitrososphaerota archaeon]